MQLERQVTSLISPTRFLFSGVEKGYLPGKRKLYFTNVELGTALGSQATRFIPLAEHNRAAQAGGAALVGFSKGQTADKALFDDDRKSSSLFMKKGQRPNPSTDKPANVAFTTHYCPHNYSDDWSKTKFYDKALREWPRIDGVIYHLCGLDFHTAFIQAGACIVQNPEQLISANKEGLIPIILCKEKDPFSIRASVHT
ncbi:hypothetical protein K469DRAFT_684345 [Zopfia rhizophila CBS 207.26]|uniref:Uncharacterized protein n=1 Tax=Zopfia rhizophila CBS 207.26 TaxID=1314779 RepID=A0A6A6ED07_9PEZI|nr:hypothetical protein K469DRAFT_684345 [Zopfia rhizophila CBS 207.26]